MTWSIDARGHHNKNYDDWKADEYRMLEIFLTGVEADDTVTTTFKFQGNHVTASSIEEAREKLSLYKQENI